MSYKPPASGLFREACEREAFAIAGRLKVEVAASEFGPDHWHLFVVRAKNYSEVELARRFKGATSRALRRDLPQQVRKYEWGDHFWSHGYFSETIGRVTTETIKHYIEKSQTKHWPQPKQTTLTAY